MALRKEQEKAIPVLLVSRTLSDAADKCGIPEHTLRRWLKEPEFRDAYSDACARILDATIHQIQESLSAALTTLVKDLASTDFEQRFRAACKLLEVGIQGITLGHLGRRIRALEEVA